MTPAPAEGTPLRAEDLTPIQAMLLEVYRTHTRYGYPGITPGTLAHDPSSCRKCALLAQDRQAFEDVLPWADIRHLHQIGQRNGRVRDATPPHRERPTP